MSSPTGSGFQRLVIGLLTSILALLVSIGAWAYTVNGRLVQSEVMTRRLEPQLDALDLRVQELAIRVSLLERKP